MKRKLSKTQLRIALAVAEALEGQEYRDAFIGVLSTMAMSIVIGAPNREQALADATQFGEYLRGTVAAGLDSKLAFVGGPRQ